MTNTCNPSIRFNCVTARYRAYEINNSVLKFDGLFQVLFFMTVSMFALDKTEIILTGVLYLPFALGWGIAVAETVSFCLMRDS